MQIARVLGLISFILIANAIAYEEIGEYEYSPWALNPYDHKDHGTGFPAIEISRETGLEIVKQWCTYKTRENIGTVQLKDRYGEYRWHIKCLKGKCAINPIGKGYIYCKI